MQASIDESICRSAGAWASVVRLHGEDVFLFFYFSKSFFTEIYFRFHNLLFGCRAGSPLPPSCRAVGILM